MTPVELAVARALCDAASPAPWSDKPEPWPVRNQWFEDRPGHRVESRGTAFAFGVAVAVAVTPDDAAFIAAARDGWPAALDEVERLRTVMDAVHFDALIAAFRQRAEAAERDLDDQRKRGDAFRRELGEGPLAVGFEEFYLLRLPIESHERSRSEDGGRKNTNPEFGRTHRPKCGLARHARLQELGGV